MAAGLMAQPTPPPPPRPPAGRTVTVSSPSAARPFIGVGLAEIDSERAKALKLKEERGVEITYVEENSPAQKAGLKQGDVVLEYNGQRVEGTDQFMRFVRETPVGRTVKLGLSRDGRLETAQVVVGTRKASNAPMAWSMPSGGFEIRMPDIPRGIMVWGSGALGIDAEAVDGQLADFFGVKEGVLVRSVSKGSAAEKAGLKAGDILIKVDGTAVSSPSEVTRALRSAKNKKSVPLVLFRDKKEITLTAEIDSERSEWREFPDFENYRLQMDGLRDQMNNLRQRLQDMPRPRVVAPARVIKM